jgi:FkbM family methyltransferase
MALPPFKGRDRVFLEARRLLSDPGRQLVGRTAEGFDLVLDLGDELDAEVYVYGRYDPAAAAVLKALVRPGDTVLDLGANVGYLTLVLAIAVGPAGRVVAFEPSPSTHRRLLHNLTLNRATWVTAERLAVGSRPGTAVLAQRFRARSGDSSLTSEIPSGAFAHHEVRIETLDRYCSDHPLKPSLIKMDVEGSELPALQGGVRLLREARPSLLMEFNTAASRSFGYTPSDLMSWLGSEFGYRFHLIADGRLREMDAGEAEADLNHNVLATAGIGAETLERVDRAIATESRPPPLEIWPPPSLSQVARRQKTPDQSISWSGSWIPSSRRKSSVASRQLAMAP